MRAAAISLMRARNAASSGAALPRYWIEGRLKRVAAHARRPLTPQRSFRPPTNTRRVAGFTSFFPARPESLGTPEIRELRQLPEENAKLKSIVADLSLDRKMLQEII
jgi:hypothetical protein